MESLKTQLQKSQYAALPTLTADDLDERGSQGKTVLVDEYPFTEDFVEPPINGGWVCKYVGSKTVGQSGKIILLPNSDWTRKLWRNGQVLYATNKGLSTEHAERWVASRIGVKHDLLDLVVQLVNDKSLQEKYSQYEVGGDRDSFLKWQSRTGISDNLSAVKRNMLIRLLDELLNPKPIKKRGGAPRNKTKPVEETTSAE